MSLDEIAKMLNKTVDEVKQILQVVSSNRQL